MSIAESIASMEEQHFLIHAGSVRVLDRSRCLWVAHVRTEDRPGFSKGTYAMLVHGSDYLLLTGDQLPALGTWCFEQARKL